eukprot:gene24023-biopygen17884
MPVQSTLTGRPLRASRVQNVVQPNGGTGTGISTKSFEYWAPGILNRFSQDDPLKSNADADEEINGLSDSDNEEDECPKSSWKPPADEFLLQRKGYYGHLTEKFWGLREVTDEEGRIIVWTDGSSQTIKGKLKAGAGVFYGNNNSLNRGVQVKGAQTNQRAELSAAIAAIENDNRPLRIVTDSNYVHGGITAWRHNWRAMAWMKKPSKAQQIDNADLWKKLDRLLNEKADGHIITQWTKGHPLPMHLHNKQSTQRDAWGNTAADGLAGKAALSATNFIWCQPSTDLRLVHQQKI